MAHIPVQRQSRPFRGELPVIGFTLAYMAVALGAALVFRNREFIFYLVVMAVLLAAVICVHLKVRFHTGTLWGLSFWGLAHMAGGLMPIPQTWPRLGESQVLYNLWLVPGLLKFDQLVHAYGFGLVTWMCWQGVQKALRDCGRTVLPTFGLLTICAAAGMGFGALNEVVEFVAVLTLPGTNVGGYVNTGWDLVSNLAGTILGAVLIRVCSARRTGGEK